MKANSLKRHVGRMTNTGGRVAVVFRTLPDEAENCLVIETDRLPDMYHDNLMTILNSRDAQEELDFYKVLQRRQFGDGTNCLQQCHASNWMKKVPVSMIEMMPYPNTAVALSVINDEIDGPRPVTEAAAPAVNDDASAAEAELMASLAARPDAPVGSTVQPDPDAKANSLIERASIMEQTAAQLREEAYMIVPSLRPGPGRPKLTEEEAAAKKEERNARRREKYAKQKSADE